MKRRIFIAADLSENLKEKLAEMLPQWRWLPIRWVPVEHWHVTVLPPAYLEDAELDALIVALRNARLGGPFSCTFSKITLAPPGKPARMVWLEGDTPPELGTLADRIAAVWKGTDTMPRAPSNQRAPNLHATLARFEPGNLAELEAKTRVLADVRLSCVVGEIAVVESELRSEGVHYETRATIPI